MVKVLKYVEHVSGVGAGTSGGGCGGCDCVENLAAEIPNLPLRDAPQDTDLIVLEAGGVLYNLPLGDIPGGGGGDVIQQYSTINFDNGGNISKVVGYAQTVKNSSNEGFCSFTIALLASGLGTFDMSSRMPNPFPRPMPAAYGEGHMPYTFESQSYDGYTAEEIHAYLNIQQSGIWQILEPFDSALNGKWLFFSGTYPIAPIL